MGPIKRAAGIYAPNTAAAPRFLDRVRDECDAATSRGIHTLAFPTETPELAVVIAEEGFPPVQWASRFDGSFAILDGEIYNSHELGHVAGGPSANDADILFSLYFSDGQEALARIDGAMSLVIWDATRELLLLYRDRSGIVPIFYSEQPDGLVWASDIPTLLRTNVGRNVNLPALDFFLGNGLVPAPWTCVERINKIPPAHVLTVPRSGRVSLRRYWKACGRPKLELHPEEANEHLAQLFENSLRRRSSTDAQTGVLLSGGVDSKLVVAGLKSQLGVIPHTFTFHYSDYEGEFNEIDDARRTADYFGTQHHEIIFRPSDIADNVESMVRSYGEPFTYGLHSFLLRDVTQAGVSVLLNGAGPDGWYLHKTNEYGLRYARLPSMVQKLGGASMRLLRRMNFAARPSWLWRVYAAAGEAADTSEPVFWCATTGLPASLGGPILPDQWRAAFYSDPSLLSSCERSTQQLLSSALSEYGGESDRDKITFLHRHFRHADGILQWNHWWARAHGLAIRFPYFDDSLLEFMMRLPRMSRDKEEIRRVAARFMPSQMACARKVSQTVPIKEWFRGPLKDFLRDQLTPGRLRESGIFDVVAVENCIRQHLRGEKDNAWLLWAIITILVWKDLLVRRGL
jgi:asparagine synthase (glutamine-hydrolysing)